MKLCLRSVCGLGLAVVIALSGAVQAADQSPASPLNNMDPLVQVLVSKGVITADEGRNIGSGSPAQQRDKLVLLLKEKGIISATEVETLRTPPPASAQVAPSLVASVAPMLPPATPQKTEAAKPAAPPAPAVIAAIAPIRALQLEGAKQGGLVPDLKLGSGAKLKLYGFFKVSAVHDSSVGQAGQANDFPLPGFLADTGPSGAPEFHLKARAFRIGSNFEWPDIAGSKMSLTGRIEMDFEGNFTRANNRNISSIRSSQPSLRLAWMRMDYPIGAKTNWFALFGQDWTPFGSSTLPNLVETTGLGIGYGSLYERAPQIRTGFLHTIGGKRAFKFGPEFAVVLPGFGNTPGFLGQQTILVPTALPAAATPVAVVTAGPGNIGDQLAYGERQGPDAEKPELEGRLVFQWQLDPAKGVAPAQFIVSGMRGWRKSIVTAAAIPCTTGFLAASYGAAGCPAGTGTYRAAFPQGAEVEARRFGYTGEIQLPTRFLTLIAKYYNGTDLRWFFAGQLFSHFNNTAGMTGVVNAPSIDGSDTVAIGLLGGVPTIAPQTSVRAQGGFVNLGFPLSRIFNANPAGRNAGWSMYLHYGTDQVYQSFLRRFSPNGRARSYLYAGNIQYKLNTYVTFAYEGSLYQTRTIGRATFQGVPQREWHDVRNEFATIFTF